MKTGVVVMVILAAVAFLAGFPMLASAVETGASGQMAPEVMMLLIAIGALCAAILLVFATGWWVPQWIGEEMRIRLALEAPFKHREIEGVVAVLDSGMVTSDKYVDTMYCKEDPVVITKFINTGRIEDIGDANDAN